MTVTYDEILYPTDGSESAEGAFEHAVSLAGAYDARLHVLYVVNTTYAGVGAGGGTNISSLRETGESVLSEFARRTEAEGIDVQTHLEEGDPYTQIISKSEGMDAIVMGTRGRTGIDRYLLGSVTEKVVRSADPPVFTVRTVIEE
ncbi:MAG: universal stress protein [Natronomonas sp.]